MPLLDTPEHSQASLDQSIVESLLLSSEFWCAQGFVCALQESVSPVLCKFWWLYGGVEGDRLQDSLCHTQFYSCPCSRPLLTCTSAEDTQTLKVRSCSVSVGSPGTHKVLFVPSKNLFPQSCVSSGGSMVGLMATSSKRAYAIPRSAAPRAHVKGHR